MDSPQAVDGPVPRPSPTDHVDGGQFNYLLAGFKPSGDAGSNTELYQNLGNKGLAKYTYH